MIQPTKSKIILFGASGMVGQNILEHALANKYQFLSPSRKELDLTNAEATYAYIKKNNPKNNIKIILFCINLSNSY